MSKLTKKWYDKYVESEKKAEELAKENESLKNKVALFAKTFNGLFGPIIRTSSAHPQDSSHS